MKIRNSVKVHLMNLSIFKSIRRHFRTSHLARSALEYLMFISPPPRAMRILVKRMQILKIDTVLDVGANVGQFGVDLRRNGYQGKIFSFEPVHSNFNVLLSTSRNDDNWEVFHKALGERNEILKINVSGNDGLSSSILPMGKTHQEVFPQSRYEYSEEVTIETLLEQFSTLGIDPKTTLLKMDVQGFERKVLLGGIEIIPEIPLCYFEASLSPLYEGEASFLELLKLLDSLGHHVADLFRGALDQRGQLLQVDVLSSSIDG